MIVAPAARRRERSGLFLLVRGWLAVTTSVDAPVAAQRKVGAVTTGLPHALRSDAADNREHILAVARAVFTAEGLNVPMREVARRAGVGPATLYRRFPTKEALASEVFADEVRACHAILDEGLAEPDPWLGLCIVIEKLYELHARNRGFTAAFNSEFPEAIDVVADRRSSLTVLTEIMRRARDAEALRRDVVLDDLVLMLLANRGIRTGSPAAQMAASRRLAALTIEAFSAHRVAHTPAPS